MGASLVKRDCSSGRRPAGQFPDILVTTGKAKEREPHENRAKGIQLAQHGRSERRRFLRVSRVAVVGVISDTHGLLRPEALRALDGSDLIIHGGDVGRPEILDALRALAPVVAVRGNIDHGAWAEALPLVASAATDSAAIYVLHDLKQLDLDPAASGFRVVVSGHSHKPSRTERNGVLYLNPGSAGPRRFKLPVTIARLDLSESPWQVDFVELAPRVV
jgi:uncharacterized protein